MPDKSAYIIYLYPSAADDQWAFLHRFFHPGIRSHDKKCALLGSSIDNLYHTFLSVTVRDFSAGKSKRIHIPFSIISAMIEIPSHKSQLGFLDPSKLPYKPEPKEKT
jgi:hypothetical protein